MALKIIFMGTPEFAVPSLKMLLENGYSIPAVITAPDKPSGRGQKIHFSAIKEFVLHYNQELLNRDSERNLITILQPEKLKNPEFLSLLESFKPDLQIVVAFRMLPKVIWAMPSKGTINLHGSLLPQYRGAAPINWAIINGEKESGVSTFFLNEEIDTGELILQKKLSIGEKETAGAYQERLMILGAQLVLETVRAIEDHTIHPIKQSINTKNTLFSAPKLEKATGLIHWNQTTESIFNLIRGLSPVPTAFTHLNSLIFKIYWAEKYIRHHNHSPGTIETDGKTFIRYYTLDGWIEPLEVQLENKKRMNTIELLRGYRLSPGIIFSDSIN